MTKFFKSDPGSKELKGGFTSSEIARQPETWKETWRQIREENEKLTHFLQKVLTHEKLNIVLTGAGSSAFIGDVVAPTWKKYLNRPVQAIPTTDLVTHFEDYIVTESPLLLISFARSGNSPESTAAINRADTFCETVYHLIITCNPEGKLAQIDETEDNCIFLLPPEAEDQSLAMTNSFTSMALAACLIPRLIPETEHSIISQNIDLMAAYGKKIMDNYIPLLKEIAEADFNRIIFLGSGPLQGTAKESHLKVQELTNGEVLGKFDSFLGFRHGPKAVINDETLIVYLLSNNIRTNRYENDLVYQIAQHDIDLITLAIAESNNFSPEVDYAISIADSSRLPEDFWAIFCTLPAQILGFYKSLLLGYNPDSPSPAGTISRVVEGVKIYDDIDKEPDDSSDRE